MPRLNHIQASMTTGELDPELAAREDIAFYRSGVKIAQNVEPRPQGGSARRGGFSAAGRYRGPLQELDISSATVAAPLGSNAANGVDGDDATLVTTGAYATPDEVIYTLDYGSVPSGNQVAIDVNLAAVAVDETQVWELQYSTDNAAWTTAGTITVDSTDSYSARVASTPGSNWGSPRYWRIRRSSGTSSNATFAELKIWTEAAISNAAVAPFTYSVDTEYSMILTGGNVDIYRDETDAYVASARIPHADDEVMQVTWAQSLDTMILFHKDVMIWRLFRLGSDSRWDFREQPFETESQYAWDDDTVSGGVNEQQSIILEGWGSGDAFRLSLEGEYTADINHGDSVATVAATIEGLSQVTDVVVTKPDGNTYRIEFQNVDGSQPWPLMVVSASAGTFTADLERSQRGKYPTSPLWSEDHGYPSCGTFHQGRFYMAGFRDQPDIVVGSRAGIFFDMELDEDPVDDSPLQFRADSDEQVSIVQIHSGPNLQIFTSSGEFYVPTDTITPTEIGQKQTSRIGAQAGLAVFDVEGGTFFVAASGRSIREYIFVDTAQSYTANPVSLLAGDKVRDPTAVALRRARGDNEAAVYYIANTGRDKSGVRVPMATISTLREQQVTAFSRIKTRFDYPMGVAATQKGSTWITIPREINGSTVGMVEKVDADYLLDSGRRYVNPDYDEFDAAEAQTVFTYTFSSPGASSGIKVWTRQAPTEEAPRPTWVAVDSGDYTVSLGGQTVTFDTAPRAADGNPVEVRINKRITSLTIADEAAHLDGETIQVMVDRYPVADQAPSSSVLDLSSTPADFEVHYGYGFTCRIVTMPFREETRAGPTYGIKARIPECLIQVYRCGDIEVGPLGGNIAHVKGTFDSSQAATQHIEAALVTDSVGRAGMRGWHFDVSLDIRGRGNMDFNVLAAQYWVRL